MEILKHVETVMLVKVIGFWLMILGSIYMMSLIDRRSNWSAFKKSYYYNNSTIGVLFLSVKWGGIIVILGALLAEFVYWYFVKL